MAILDGFVDTAGTDLASHVSPGGQTWTNQNITTLSISPSGKLALCGTLSGSGVYKWNLPAISADETFSITYAMPIGSPNDFFFSITLRGAHPSGFTGYVGIVERVGGALYLSLNKDGSPLTAVAVPGLDDGLAHVLTLMCQGTLLTLSVDGTSRLTATDATYTVQGDTRINIRNASTGIPAGFYLTSLSIDVAPTIPPIPPTSVQSVSGQLWPRGGGRQRAHPDAPPAAPTAFDEEFDAPLGTKWTVAPGAIPTLYDVNTTWPSWLHCWAKAPISASMTPLYLKQTITGVPAGTAFSCTMKVCNDGVMNYSTVGFRMERLTDGSAGNDCIEFDVQFNGARLFNNHKQVAGTWTFGVSSTSVPAGAGDLFLHLQRDVSNVWTFYWSLNGRTWFQLATITLSFAIGEILLECGPSGQTTPSVNFGIDWFRVNWQTL